MYETGSDQLIADCGLRIADSKKRQFAIRNSKSEIPSAGRRVQRFIITIDGPAGVGKSTVAKLLAKRLRLRYLDTGATYRALAYRALLEGVDPKDEERLMPLARALRVELRRSATDRMTVLLHGREVTRQIRTERVTEAAAAVAQHPRVRGAMVRLQRQLADAQACVVEGRDTGSVVFPKARCKFFLTATVRVRAHRRQRELRSVQGRAPSLRVIARQLTARDGLDRRRTIGPLVKPPSAMTVDTSHLRAEAVVRRMLKHVRLSR